jgi:rhodanese-related sulfurtransferase
VTLVHRILAVIAAALALTAFAADGWPGNVSAAGDARETPRYITAPDLAVRIISRKPGLQVFDLRSRADYDSFHVPGATHASVGRLLRQPRQAGTTMVLYGNSVTHASRAASRLLGRGADDVFVLRGGLHEWIARVHEPRLAVDATAAEREEFERATRLSLFFGGRAHEDVPRADLPRGYWTGHADERAGIESTLLAVAAIRRRGC